MDNGDANPAAQAQPNAQDLQQQVYLLQQQLQAQNNLYLQQQQFFAFQQQQQQQQRMRVAEPHKVKLAPIWTNQIRSWFALAESQFGTYAVADPRQCFNLVVAALNDDARLHAKAVIENPAVYQDPYVALRNRLLEVYEPSVWQQAAEFLKHGELGDRRPSDMMDEMLALLPADLNVLVKAAFLGRLPADMRDHVQRGAEVLSFQQLAARADEIWQARRANAAKAVAAVVEPGEQSAVDPAELEQVLAAVRFVRQQKKGGRQQRTGGGGAPPSGGSGGGQDGGQKKQLCWRHERFGARAYKCESASTCQFTKN